LMDIADDLVKYLLWKLRQRAISEPVAQAKSGNRG
jgi:hypothetical protein